MEDFTKPAKNICPQCKNYDNHTLVTLLNIHTLHLTPSACPLRAQKSLASCHGRSQLFIFVVKLRLYRIEIVIMTSSTLRSLAEPDPCWLDVE